MKQNAIFFSGLTVFLGLAAYGTQTRYKEYDQQLSSVASIPHFLETRDVYLRAQTLENQALELSGTREFWVDPKIHQRSTDYFTKSADTYRECNRILPRKKFSRLKDEYESLESLRTHYCLDTFFFAALSAVFSTQAVPRMIPAKNKKGKE